MTTVASVGTCPARGAGIAVRRIHQHVVASSKHDMGLCADAEHLASRIAQLVAARIVAVASEVAMARRPPTAAGIAKKRGRLPSLRTKDVAAATRVLSAGGDSCPLVARGRTVAAKHKEMAARRSVPHDVIQDDTQATVGDA